MAFTGKKIKITKAGVGTVNAILNEEVSYSIASNYTNMLDDLGLSNVKTVLAKVGTYASNTASVLGIGGEALKDTTFVFKEASIPRWSGTEPLKMQISINLYNDETGSITAYKYAKMLQKMVLPSDGGTDGDSKWKGLVPPIPNTIDSLLTASRNYTKNQEGFVSIKIGRIIKLHNVIIDSADMTYSTDITSASKPLYIKMNLGIRTVGAVTSSAIDQGMKWGKQKK